MSEYKFASSNRRRGQEAAEKREKIIVLLRGGMLVDEACAKVGISKSGYARWRMNSAEFRLRVEAARTGKVPAAPGWALGFAEFRLKYFGMHSPWFHLLAIEAYEKTPPGNITLILWPPEHGKTTLFEDYAAYKLAVDPSYRFTVGSEKKDMSKKILGRVRARMEQGTPFPDYLNDWGPFAPQTGEGKRQTWGADQFSVWKKQGQDERDYSMAALGFGSAIAGTRTDHLHGDDLTSLQNYNQTSDLVETFRQDWLTRPGEHGRTTLNGTRVGEDDFYEELEKEIDDTILRVIKFPALYLYTDQRNENGNVGRYAPLWERDETMRNPFTGQPAGYTMDQLARMRAKVGEDAWSRNYMQNPRASKLKTFTDEVIRPSLNHLRSVSHPPPSGTACVVSIDPAMGQGRNAILSVAFHLRKLKVLDIVEDQGFTRTEQIWDRLEDVVLVTQRQGASVTDVVIEANAFQKSMIDDRQLRKLQDRYGFGVRPHITGLNKYDENIGVATMARDLRVANIELPYAHDDETRMRIDELIRQLKAWKPNEKGTKLRQDQVMALWFGWILWRDRRGGEEISTEDFGFRSMPFRPLHAAALMGVN